MATATTPPPATTDARPTPPAAAVRRTRTPQLVVGMLLTAGAALGFVLFNAASVQRTPVLALANDIDRGHILAVDDLQVVYVGTDDVLALTSADRADLLVGRAAVLALPAGTLLTVDQLAEGRTLVPGAGVVGLALSPGQYPTPRLAIGDLVNVLEVTDGDQLLVEAAEVVEVELVGTQGQRFISVLTGEEQAATVAAAAASGEVRLVLIARDGDATPEGPGHPDGEPAP
jgi:hypothetical protein